MRMLPVGLLMRTCAMLLPALLLAPMSVAAAAASHAKPPVVLLHGLARSSASMQPMARALEQAGYAVCNLSYPSREYPIDVLARNHVAPQIARCFPQQRGPLHFVTHSMGGIIVRVLDRSGDAGPIGRVVMLSPPNQGSEVVDRLGGWQLFQALNGPAGGQLGTDLRSAPQQLGPARFELGIITGNRSINWMLSLLIPGPDDGKVAVSRAQLEGMRDFIVLRASHPFIMQSPQAIAQTLVFLQEGRFRHDPAAATVPATSYERRRDLPAAGAAPRKAAINSSQ